jgi:hypothetical protein
MTTMTTPALLLRTELLSAFRARLMTAPSITQWVVRFANREAIGATALDMNAPYLEELPFSTNSGQATMGDTVQWRETTGTWQLMLATPVGIDVFDVLAMADELENLFVAMPCMTLADGVTPICIINVLVGTPRPMRQDDPWVRVPVVFTYRVTSHN